MITREHDVIIVGGGLAGLRAAVGLCEKYDVALISKVHPLRSHSIAAQGGINAALGNNPDSADDSWEKHAFDTIKGSDYLADQDAVEIMCREATGIVYEMEHWGCPFSRFSDGSIAQRPFGGAGYPRTCYSADLTGHVLLNTLFEKAASLGVKIYPEWHVLALAIHENTCHGVAAFDLMNGELVSLVAKATLFATGGYGRVYFYSTNALINTGSGIGMAYKAGVPLKDMEFVQFHPTGLIGTNILMTEACRGEGGYLINAKGERFMEKYAPKAMELAPRDIVSRSIQTEIDEGRCLEHPLGNYIRLDLMHLGEKKILEKLPGIRKICIDFIGIDPVAEPIPIMPCQHYSMGGIDTDAATATEVQGFFAAGECACVSVHGGNRLGGNSLLETIVFGKIAAASIDTYLSVTASTRDKDICLSTARAVEIKIEGLLAGGHEKTFQLHGELAKTMSTYVGIFREQGDVKKAMEEIEALKKRYRNVGVSSPSLTMNYELMNAIELGYMFDVAHSIAYGALLREESRGAHSRTDFPKRDDEKWLKHSIARVTGTGVPDISYRDVTVTRYKPMERTY
ncbi:MAG: FAD-dependent oxidoreductase [Syntrophorhabdaceae bacterium]|nr:FAD-dependent oxidoreductase [Syntrophorhabdaceae bacterium]MDD4197642.1 FAD-dependent oxidoreductase [Syntrophorhabdaceae bacterium]